MAKRIIECTVKDEYLLGSGVPVGAAGSHDDVVLRVTFGEQWYGLNIYAIWRDSFGANPVLIPLTPNMLFKPMVYDIPVTAAAKKYAGRIFLTLSGYSIVDGSEEDTATVTNEAYFRVLPSGYRILDDSSVTPTIAQQMLDSFNKLKIKELAASEEARVVEERVRIAQENQRCINENERISSENLRKNAEDSRNKAVNTAIEDLMTRAENGEFDGKGLNWRGAYESGSAYERADAVSYEGSSYIANVDIAAGNIEATPDNPEYWDLLATMGIPEKGVDYFTLEDKEELKQELLAELPSGGGGGGGGGGSTNSAVMSLKNESGWLSKTISEGADCDITFSWSSLEDEIPTGNGVLNIIVGGTTKASYEIQQGEFTINVGRYLSAGTNKVRIQVSDAYDNTRIISFSINAIAISISSYFDGSVAYTGAIQFSYTPVGAVEKTIHFLIDGEEIATRKVTTSGRTQIYNIPAQAHGSHTLEVYFTCTVDEQEVESNHLYYDLICYEEGNLFHIISVPKKITAVKQYDTVAIPYVVYKPDVLTSSVVLKDGEVSTPLTVDRTQQIWSYKALRAGDITLSIESGAIRKEIHFTVAASDISVEAEDTNLELYLSSNGRSNNEENPLVWSYEGVSAEMTNFNLKSDGWKLDQDNNTVLRVSGDARVYIPFNIFAKDFRANGKTIEFEFATRDVLNYDAPIITAWSGGRGIQITAQKALLKSEQSEIFTQFKENEIVRIAFSVEKSAENRFLAIYINGIISGVVQYPSGDNFQQTNAVGISIGSNDCTTDIYCIRVYDSNLTMYQLLANWIADTQNAADMADRYTRNNIFDDYDNITVSKLPSNLPYMVLYVDNYTDLPQSKGDKKRVSGRYVDPMNPSRSFTFTNAEFDVQGTSSQFYSRKNYKAEFENGFNINGVNSSTYKLRDGSMPTNIFTFKADVASSEGANNVELVKLYNDTCPVKTAPQRVDSRVRQGIDGYPMLMFYGTGSTPTFLGKYNFNNDKATAEVFGFALGDESWEILQNNTQMVIFKDDNFEGDTWKTSFEGRYPDKNTDTTKLKEFASWLKSTDTTAVSSEAEKAARLEKFKTEFETYADKDAMIFNYIFTEMFLMVDNRAKNAFPTRYSADGKWIILPYDYDTAIGINNEGELKFGYELEDTDLVNGNNVYNGQDSVLYVNMRLAFADEIMAMYKTLRSGDVFSYEEIEKRFEEHQNVWGEAVFNEDAKFKYLDPLVNEGDKTYLPMLQGSKAEQRKWWLYNRFRYLDSKYNAGDALEDFINLRSYAVADIEVTPYADIYATAAFDSALVQKRALRGQSYTLENPLSGGKDAVISIYSASQLASIGDLSGLKVGLANFSKAVKLSSLKVGSADEGYNNPNLTDLTIGNLVLLRSLDVRNCSALAQAVDLSGCTNIEHVYLEGTITTGVTLPNGGILKTLHLPSTVTNLTILNQPQLTDFVLPSYENISTLRLENAGVLMTRVSNITSQIQADARVRIIGGDWTVQSAEEIYTIMESFEGFKGLDENGGNLDNAVVSGTFHISTITGAEYTELKEAYPNITIDYGTLTSTVHFYDGETLLSTQTVAEGTAITVPEVTRENTAQYTYTFMGWSIDGVNVVEITVAGTSDVNYYAVFNQELNYYTVRFLNSDGTVLQETVEPYGAIPEYKGATPIDPTGEGGTFKGWDKEIVAVTDSVDYTARIVVEALAYALSNGEYAVSGIGTVESTDIVIPSTYKGLPVTSIANSAFFRNSNITSVVIPDSVTSIGTISFNKCSNLTSVRLPNGLKAIKTSTFSNAGITEIVIPDSVTTIENTAFSDCEKLVSITIGSGVNNIQYNILRGCTALETIIVLATTPPTLADATSLSIPSSSSAIIYVPKGCGDAYKAATNWSAYADNIQELTE